MRLSSLLNLYRMLSVSYNNNVILFFFFENVGIYVCLEFFLSEVACTGSCIDFSFFFIALNRTGFSAIVSASIVI